MNVDATVRQSLPWRTTFLGANTTAIVAAAFTGLIVARGQFARAVRPIIGYANRRGPGELLPSLGDDRWTIWIYNGGPSTASIHKVDYLCVSKKSSPRHHQWLTDSQVRDYLADLGLADGADYALRRLGEGAPVPSGGRQPDGLEILSFGRSFMEKLQSFDIRLRVSDVAGDLHERILGCIHSSDTSREA